MFESIIINTLKADPELGDYVSSYQGQPAIFSEEAPEDTEKPFIIIELNRQSTGHLALQTFTLDVDYLDTNKSRTNSRKAVQRIEFALDQAILTHERYDSIRLSFESAGPVPSTDARDIHYNTQFSVRAGRKAWCKQLT